MVDQLPDAVWLCDETAPHPEFDASVQIVVDTGRLRNGTAEVREFVFPHQDISLRNAREIKIFCLRADLRLRTARITARMCSLPF